MITEDRGLKLSPRLESIARLVTPGLRAADIGTDHAYLPIWLCRNGIVPSAIASDLKPGPLETASAHIRRAGLEEKITVRQSDGLRAFSEGEAESFILAGMGGKLICRILGDRPDLLPSVREFLLQPQSEIGEVRRFLTKHGFRIETETCTEDEGKFYPVIRAVPRGSVSVQYTEEELLYGPVLLRDRDPLLKKWLSGRLELTETILRDLESRGGDAVFRRCRELREEEQHLKTALKRYEM